MYKDLEEKNEFKYKARLVVRSFQQDRKTSFDDIYSPLARIVTIRAFLIIGNQLRHYFQQLDVKTAFLNGTIDDDIYIYPREGINCRQRKVFKLKKSLYGLRQSSKCWNEEINSYLLELGFMRSENDFCLYILNHEGKVVYALLI